MKKLRTYIILILGITGLLLTSCQELQVENLNEPDIDKALAEPADLISLLQGANTTLFEAMKRRDNCVFDNLGDQMTGTNAFYGWWDMAIEPKPRLNNEPTYADAHLIEGFWNDYNNVIFTANLILDRINNEEVQITDPNTGEDITKDMLASAYLVRGMAQGYIGLIYDKGYIIDENTDLSSIDPNSTNTPIEMVENAINSLELAKNVANENNITFDYLGTQFNSTETVKLANSFAARFLVNVARNNAQLSEYDWSKILNYAENGIGEDFYISSTSDIVSEWNLYQSLSVNGGAGHYQHTDLKVINLMDPSYPKRYPSEGFLEPAESNDNRLTTDFVFDYDFGFLRESRGRHLFSTYAHVRWFADQYNAGSYSGIPCPIFLVTELDLIKAEALTQLGRNNEAKDILDNGSRSTRGGLPNLPDSNKETLLDAIYYEYCVEMYGAEQGVQFYNMRRYNRLQKGTPLHLPIPGSELEINGIAIYTFGGEANADGVNTSNGENAWVEPWDGK